MGEYFEKGLFINRELSWLEFNKRVLLEAEDKNVPLLERFKFLSIYFSNLDEFFMVRVGSLTDQKIIEPDKIDDKTGWNADEQLRNIFVNVDKVLPIAEEIYSQLVSKLKFENIDILNFNHLNKVGELIIERYFTIDIKPLLSPQVIDRNHPFPFLKNLDTYIFISFESKPENPKFGIIPISHLPQYFLFNIDERQKIVLTADIVLKFADRLFNKYSIEESNIIRVTRNADISVDEAIFDYDTDIDFRGVMQELLKKRKRLATVRVQMSKQPSEKFTNYISEKLEINEKQIFIQNMPLDFSFGFKIIGSLGKKYNKLLFKEHKITKSIDFNKGKALRYIEENDLLLNFPFQSIQPFVDILYEAADNPSVISIKISLYRLANHSKIVSALAYAAERGKDVLCVLELRARFDEQNNIDYAKILEDAGCTVMYGLSDYKIHAKLCLITKKVHNHISYITQVGTGNYNEKTSEQYTDISLITSDYDIGCDANEMFRSLCLNEVVEKTKSLWIAPNCYKANLLKMIDDEIARQKEFNDGYIAIKVNSMNDMEVMSKFIEASKAGVKVDLFIRGICCICPGVEGYTENITVKSIVGRYLEHSRIFCFGKNDRQRVFIGSGDLLNRNTTRRVEVFAEAKNKNIRKELVKILKICQKDNVKAWIMQNDGNYIKNLDDKDELLNSQEFLFEYFSKSVKISNTRGIRNKLLQLFK